MLDLTSAPTTKIEIISAAIAMVGKQQTVNTIDGGGALATSGEKLYDVLVSAELSSNRWRFCQNFKQLSILTTLTPSFDGWLYYAEVPSDCLMIQYVTPNVVYLVFGNRILTKSVQPITVVYGENVPVSKWPGAFSMYIVYHLATLMGHAVSNSDRLLARLSGEMKTWESRALFADAQSSSTQAFRFKPYVDVRYQNRSRGGW